MRELLTIAGAAAAALFLAGGAEAAPAPRWQATVSPTGSIRLSDGGRDFGALEPGLFDEGWQAASLGAGRSWEAPADGVRRGQIRAPSGVLVDSELRADPVANGVRLDYRLTPQKDVRLNSLNVHLAVATSLLAGGRYTADGKAGEFPVAYGETHLFRADTRVLEIATAAGGRLRFEFAQPTPVLIQDDRQWGPSFTFRFGTEGDAIPWAGGKWLAVAFTLTATGGMAVDHDGPTTIQAGAEWLPLDVELDVEAGSALDFTNLVPWHEPAGKLGRVIATPDGKMAFANQPDQPARFYGFNLCFSAHYITHEQSDQLAARLRRLGYNAVRFHHYESELVDRSGGTTTKLNPEKLDQLDYLFAALKRQGIYVTTDLFVSRPVEAAEVWEGAEGAVGMDNFKMAVPVNERAFQNFLAFSRALLAHKNPYTGMTWAEDPALAWLSLINEGNPGNFLNRMDDRLKADYARAWNAWLAARYPDRNALAKALGGLVPGQDAAAGTVPLPSQDADSPAGIQLSLFLADTQQRLLDRTRQFLRDELKCPAQLTNMNAWTNPVQLQAVRHEMDYVDDHFYVDHPEFLEQSWRLPSRCSNTSPVASGAPGGRSCAFLRVMDRPFSISEFNYSGPGRFRGVGGILTGALGAVQDWSIIWRFAYSHSRGNLFQPSTAGYFDMVTDPLSQAADRASLCLFRRGDLSPAAHSVAIAMTTAELLQSPKSARGTAPGWTGLAWVARVGTQVVRDPKEAKGADLVLPLGWSAPASAWPGNTLAVDPYAPEAGEQILAELRRRGWVKPENRTDFKGPRFQSDNGELTVDGPADTLTLDTARTAGGYAPAGKRIDTKPVSIAIEDTDATVWVSSVDNAPIAGSRRLLVTHLTDLQNTEARYGDKSRRVLLAWGKLPHLVRTGRATVTIRMNDAARARVWGLSTSGKRLAPVPARVVNGALVLPLDVNAGGKARMLYEVAVE